MVAQKFVNTTVALLALSGLLITVTTLAALSASQTIPLDGTISTVGVEAYYDNACTQPATSINIGTVGPGNIKTQTIYIKNTGTIPVTLTMGTSNWNPPEANNYLTLSWNRQNTILNPGISTGATLTLTVATDTGSLTTFTCDVTITGTE